MNMAACLLHSILDEFTKKGTLESTGPLWHPAAFRRFGGQNQWYRIYFLLAVFVERFDESCRILPYIPCKVVNLNIQSSPTNGRKLTRLKMAVKSRDDATGGGGWNHHFSPPEKSGSDRFWPGPLTLLWLTGRRGWPVARLWPDTRRRPLSLSPCSWTCKVDFHLNTPFSDVPEVKIEFLVWPRSFWYQFHYIIVVHSCVPFCRFFTLVFFHVRMAITFIGR